MYLYTLFLESLIDFLEMHINNFFEITLIHTLVCIVDMTQMHDRTTKTNTRYCLITASILNTIETISNTKSEAKLGLK
jgi:hypothetical protein